MSGCFYCGDKCRRTTVYVIGECENAPTVKVGYAANARNRLVKLRKQTGRDIQILHSTNAECEFKAMEIEDAAHEILSHFWDKGEWFACASEAATVAVKIAACRIGLKGRRQ